MNRLKRRKPLKMGTREEARVRCAQHLQWVRGHECAASGHGWHFACAGKIQAAHVRKNGDGGMGLKPGDDHALPLCEGHHRVQHQWGEDTFWNAVFVRNEGVMRAQKIAAELWARSPHGQKYRAKDRELSRLQSKNRQVGR